MSSERKILSLDPAGLLWGSERALLDFLGEIPGYEAACCLPPRSPLMSKLHEHGIRCFPCFQKNLHQRGLIAKGLALLGLMLAMLRFRPHVLHVNQAGATRIALAACRVFKVPCVSHVRLLEDVDYLNALQPSPQHLKHLIAISPSIEERLRAQPHLCQIPVSMLLDAYRPVVSGHCSSPANDSTAKRWDFICVGRMSESKGQELLIQAMSQLRQSGRCPKLVLVGEVNDWGEKLRSQVSVLGLGTHVEFAGHQEDVRSFLTQSRWLVCPSRYEPLGRVLFEAWDAGIPVIACASSGGAAGSIQASKGGLLFDDWTSTSLASQLGEALGLSQGSQHDLANTGRKWLLEATDPAQYARSIANLFHRVVSPKQRAA